MPAMQGSKTELGVCTCLESVVLAEEVSVVRKLSHALDPPDCKLKVGKRKERAVFLVWMSFHVEEGE